jgi:hypothetical protein
LTLSNSVRDINDSEPEQIIDTLLKLFSLERIEIGRDGDCLFSAVCCQLDQSVGDHSTICQDHITNLQISEAGLFSPLLLRHATLNEMETNSEIYRSFLSNTSKITFRKLIQQYKNVGEFAGNFGDLLPVAIANKLGLVIILLSSNPTHPYHTIIPRTKIHGTAPLILAFNCSGSGHYDST